MPMGRLIKKIQRQPSRSVIPPPASTPTVPAIAAIVPHAPSAFVRCGPDGKRMVTSASDAGASSAAPSPWPARAAISHATESAAPAASEATVNSISPAKNVRRWPSRSPSLPPSSRNPPRARR
jgi:hypothetical protein